MAAEVSASLNWGWGWGWGGPCLGVRPTIIHTHPCGVLCSRGVVSNCLSCLHFGLRLHPQDENEQTRRSKTNSAGSVDRNIETGPKMSGLLWRTAAARVFPKMMDCYSCSTLTRPRAVMGWTDSDDHCFVLSVIFIPNISLPMCFILFFTTNMMYASLMMMYEDVAHYVCVNRCESVSLCL